MDFHSYLFHQIKEIKVLNKFTYQTEEMSDPNIFTYNTRNLWILEKLFFIKIIMEEKS